MATAVATTTAAAPMTASSSAAAAASSRVRVAVRIRPLASRELSEGGASVVTSSALDRTVSLSSSASRRFTYDAVFHPGASQSDLYDDGASRGLLEAFLGGYNATVLAYGQTGSGKTYTMGSSGGGQSHGHGDEATAMAGDAGGGAADDCGSGGGGGAFDEDAGLIPRFTSDIFRLLVRRKEESERAALKKSSSGGECGATDADSAGADALVDFSLSASFLEVYGEDIHDLLDDDHDQDRRPSLPIREDSNGEVIVKGLRSVPISNAAEAMGVLDAGTMNRTTAATLMNTTSSRSHAVFTINLRQTTRAGGSDVDGAVDDATTTSRFTFVDLAGSERMKKTGAEGERAREGIRINEGLLALGNVINALADDGRLARGERAGHVPYRQSKLTRLLQDALGGNSQTLFVACVSPSDTNASETLSTLQYANRARNIRNAPARNVDAAALELRRLRALSNLLRCELIRQRFASAGSDAEAERTKDGEGGEAKVEEIGVVDEELLKREDVAAYMRQIDERAAELGGGGSMPNLAPLLAVSAPSNVAAARPHYAVHPSSASSSSDASGRNPIQLKALPGSVAEPAMTGSVADPAIRDSDDDAMILDVNPEEDMQIIDQLLELQQNDQRFQKEQRDDQDRLDDMDGEIQAQEGRLLQLRDHLKAYHAMKDKYERLMCEVHGLESEKCALADELERAQADPTRGCSQAIKRKLQKVEDSLARARSETRRHQQMYRRAEQEAQKCGVLERKVQDLKHAKVSLIRKQRDAAARHREFTNQKTREVHALKRREKTADRKISKMEAERRKYEASLERSRANCEKLSDKLKQTEGHLMRLLTKKRNDLNRDGARGGTRQSVARGADLRRGAEAMEGFAPTNEEVKSIRFLLEKTVSDRVMLSRSRDAYEVKIVEHGKLMQAMAREARALHARRKELKSADPDSAGAVAAQITENEDTVQELQLRIELIESDLEQLRAKCPSIEEGVFDDDAKEEDGPALKMIAKLDGPILRTLLCSLLESYVAAEIQRRALKDALVRKDSTLKSFESEVTMQNEKIVTLTKSLDRRRKLVISEGQCDPVDMIQELESEVQAANKKLNSCREDKMELTSKLEEARGALFASQVEHANAEERLALFHSQEKLTESTEGTERMLKQLQDILAAIGMSMEDRKALRAQLENCVEDACSRILDEASSLRDEKIQQVDSLRDRLAEIYAALGLQNARVADGSHPSSRSLTTQLESLDRELCKIQPQYNVALERCNRLVTDAETLTSDLHPLGNCLSDDIQKLMQNRRYAPKRKRPAQIPAQHQASVEASREARAKVFKDVQHMMKGLQTNDEASSLSSDNDPIGHAGFPRSRSPHRARAEGHSSMEPGSLSTPFLDSCERDIKKLRLAKSDRLLSNADKCEKLQAIIKQMHVGMGDLSSIVLHGLKKHKRGIPKWWNESMAGTVYAAVSKKGSVMVHGVFTDHLQLISDTVHFVSKGRQLLSDTLKTVIDDSHRALLNTAQGCGMDVNGLSQSLHDALFHLPPLSKQHVKACIDEMVMLVTAAESVTQSEIETLTVLWEGLNLTSSERGQFWGELDQMSKGIEMMTASPFDMVLQECPAEVEEWVLKSSKDATRVQRTLGIRVFKLKKIHEEVERLKRKQDSKNGIMSLNNELRLLSAKLADFEEKSCNKQRLLDKKVNSSSLLEEERFRKQMQGMFASKLETLRQMLNEWEANEGRIEDDDMLSEVVKSMLQNAHRIDAWMNEKTRFMHLRTTNTKPKHRSTPKIDRVSTSTLPLSGSRRARPRTVSSHPDISKKLSNNIAKFSTPNDRRIGQKTARAARTTAAGHRLRPTSPTPPPPQTRKALSSSRHNAPLPEKAAKGTLTVEVNENTSQVLLPFGNILAESPREKENSVHF